MSFKRFLLVLLVSVSSLVAVPASAQDDCGDRCAILNPDNGFNGWESLDPVGYAPPVYNTCTADAAHNRACRGCVLTVDSRGFVTGSTCGYVTYSDSCACNYAGTPACMGQGTCKYLS